MAAGEKSPAPDEARSDDGVLILIFLGVCGVNMYCQTFKSSSVSVHASFCLYYES